MKVEGSDRQVRPQGHGSETLEPQGFGFLVDVAFDFEAGDQCQRMSLENEELREQAWRG